jgi:transcriptional regulator with XRE-family HTH domain
MDFWIRLKNEIKAKNTTQEWISKQIGVPFGTFRKWMTRKTYPNLKEGVEIAELLGVTAEFLITGVTPEGLDNTERKLVNAFRKLSSIDKDNTLLAINAWAGKNELRKISKIK